MVSRFIPIPSPIDIARTLAPLKHGQGDPATLLGSTDLWRASRTPCGPVTAHLTATDRGVEIETWGPGAEWFWEHAPAWCGALDDDTGFDPPPGPICDLRRRHPGLRIPRTGLVTEALIPVILEQKVTASDAHRAYGRLARTLAEPAPGPAGLSLPPDPARVAELPYFAFHPFGIERRRAETLRAVCARASWLDDGALRLEEARARLASFPGIGSWTIAEVSRVALGDADAVSVGDFHLPHVVSWILAGEARGTDARMLELLEPYRPHRGRVQRLLRVSGARAPAFGPRLEPRAIDGI
ncbi:MAG: DNA-3-methyladenine glycosylase 2 family protein [Actinomycetota bacterium]